jgi:hypothetical protein
MDPGQAGAADTNGNITGQVKALDSPRDMLGFLGQQPGLAFHLRRRRISTAPHGCVKPRPGLNLDVARRLMTRRSVALFVRGLGMVYPAAGPEKQSSPYLRTSGRFVNDRLCMVSQQPVAD